MEDKITDTDIYFADIRRGWLAHLARDDGSNWEPGIGGAWGDEQMCIDAYNKVYGRTNTFSLESLK